VMPEEKKKGERGRGGAVLGLCIFLDSGAKVFNMAERQRRLELDRRHLAKAGMSDNNVGWVRTQRDPLLFQCLSGWEELRRDEREKTIHSNKDIYLLHDIFTWFPWRELIAPSIRPSVTLCVKSPPLFSFVGIDRVRRA
jgi:hypothetical protein